jgi:hypothetical protein
MTPREKAEELVKKFIEHTQEWSELDGYVINEYNAKQCALIAVDEILGLIFLSQAEINYWQEIKQEIENL